MYWNFRYIDADRDSEETITNWAYVHFWII